MKGFGYNILRDKQVRPYARRDKAKTMIHVVGPKAGQHVLLRPMINLSKDYPYNSTKRGYS